jgi:hypothetical protein
VYRWLGSLFVISTVTFVDPSIGFGSPTAIAFIASAFSEVGVAEWTCSTATENQSWSEVIRRTAHENAGQHSY